MYRIGAFEPCAIGFGWCIEVTDDLGFVASVLYDPAFGQTEIEARRALEARAREVINHLGRKQPCN